MKKPQRWGFFIYARSLKEDLSAPFEISGCKFCEGDPKFARVVNDASVATYTSGEINQIYAKWFTQPIPPKGLNLMLPMSDQLKTLIAHPTDKAVDQK
jgi:glutamate/aspartate transport system substrate-binding protein